MIRVLLTLVAVIAGKTALSCTTFLAQQNGPVVGKSYDWHQAEALVVVNKRGVEKVALLLDGSLPARWISRYGSLTFNQSVPKHHPGATRKLVQNALLEMRPPMM